MTGGATARQLAAEIVGTPTPSAGVTAGIPTVGMIDGVVTATFTGPPASVTITLGGNTTAVSGVRYHSSYVPAVNDTVKVMVVGEDKWVLGKLQP